MADGSAHTFKAQAEAKANVEAFLSGLTALSRETGIGIAGEPELFILESEDRSFVYQADDESRLTLA